MARGNRDAVLAAAKDARAGDILLHNHPSGHLEPSAADLAIAARVYGAGVGTGIVDNRGRSLYVVVEPPAPEEAAQALDPAAVSRHLLPGGGLEASYPGYEHRPSQLEMLIEVTERYNPGGVGLLEAGTGTGKSLAYLLPAVEWALANRERTVVSTHTINLQEQLAGKDLPLVRTLVGDGFRWALVKGRGNYVSLRRLLLAGESAGTLFESDRTEEMEALVEWGRETADGSLSDLTRRPPEEIWEEVRSDGDVCLGARCPHFGHCFYQRSRREANGADVLVVNHALLFADLALRRATDNWTESAVLPAYRRLVLDEAHNVEEAATRHLGAAVTRVGMTRLLDRLERSGPKGRIRRRGLLRAIEEAAALRATERDRARLAAEIEEGLRPAVADARDALGAFFTALDPFVPSKGEEPLRLGCGDPRDPLGHAGVREGLDALVAAFSRLGERVETLRGLIEEEVDLSDALEGRVLDLRSVERRLAAAARGLALVLATDEDGAEEWVRWIEERGRRRQNAVRNVALAAAPVEPGVQLREALFDRVETAVVTSATLATGTGFRFMRERLGLSPPVSPPEPSSVVPDEAGRLPVFADTAVPPSGNDGDGLTVTENLLASPFDYREQAIFCVPTDLPPLGPGPDFQFATARVVSEFAELTGGGLFVLFTSYRALGSVARRIRATDPRLGGRLLVHREAPRSRLLRQFIDGGDRILLGTASFWEGVDVRGDALRGLILQKLPFRVPTEPITQARMEAIAAKGLRPFDAYQVPLAALRLKQGFGRLVRSREDRGAVILLDSRIVTRRYGRALRAALPPAPMVRGSWAEVRRRIAEFYGG